MNSRNRALGRVEANSATDGDEVVMVCRQLHAFERSNPDDIAILDTGAAGMICNSLSTITKFGSGGSHDDFAILFRPVG